LAGFDFDRAVRWARLARQETLARREDRELPFIAAAYSGPDLLLDTCVYVDQMQARLPAAVEQLSGIRQINHRAIVVAELMHLVGRLDPQHPGTAAAIRQIGIAVKAMRPHRLFEPDAETVGRAAILSGVLCRTQGYGKDDRLRSLHDCTLFLQAAKLGLTLLSRNIRDFDLLLQLIPKARVLFYRREN
jgi:predicted nucleic acid-binding protein